MKRVSYYIYIYIYIYIIVYTYTPHIYIIYKLVTSISFSRPHRKQYKLITNDDETRQIPFTPIVRPHSVIFFSVTDKPLTCYTFFNNLKLPDECGPYNFGPYKTELSQ